MTLPPLTISLSQKKLERSPLSPHPQNFCDFFLLILSSFLLLFGFLSTFSVLLNPVSTFSVLLVVLSPYFIPLIPVPPYFILLPSLFSFSILLLSQRLILALLLLIFL